MGFPEPLLAAPQLVLVGTYPPERCGIATFTADLYEAISALGGEASTRIAAVTPRRSSFDPAAEVLSTIRRDEVDDYRLAALRINNGGARVSLQHEFGIFGGPEGEHVLAFAEALEVPLVVTLHTVLARPGNPHQLEIIRRLAAASARIVVMSERARTMLVTGWQVPESNVVVIPHGHPLPPAGPRRLPDRARLLTFGLLGRDKGIETVIRALPAIIEAHPRAIYEVLGATHPNLVAYEGESYRASLETLAQDLGVGDRLRLHDVYSSRDMLLEAILAADICVMPYLKEAHVTSGTLAYAAGLAKPVVATRFWHALDLLGEGAGKLVPFGDADRLAEAICGLLANRRLRASMGMRLASRVANDDWRSVAKRYLALFREIAPVLKSPRYASPERSTEQTPDLAGVRRMTDDVGMLQHSRLGVADRRHGYCLDDNARALLLMHRLPEPFDAERLRLARTFAAFIEHAWDEDAGCVRNFMSYDRRWRERRGSDDSLGRTVWALAVTATGPVEDLRHWADDLLAKMLPAIADIAWPRSNAFMMLGLAELCRKGRASPRVVHLLTEKASRLASLLSDRGDGWFWFEDNLSYDNARLPECLIRAGAAIGDKALIDAGRTALAWLCGRQTSPEGTFRPVATDDFSTRRAQSHLFGQQPLEAAATVDACLAALEADGDERWAREAERAIGWYCGENDLGLSLQASPGECYDGLLATGLNRNRGAESILSLQLALCAMEKVRGFAGRDIAGGRERRMVGGS